MQDKASRVFSYIFGIYGAAMVMLALFNEEWIYGFMTSAFGVINFRSK
ncbi:hypothetical protein J41TS2_38760 [Bacillus sonorensis]|nr:hypothetical protein J41TS2_38760 [Bacillus sonorensis]